MSEHKCYLVSKLEDLRSKEIEKYVNVSIVSIYFKKLDHIPVHIQVLKINSCSLQSLKNLCNLVNLKHLDIRDNLVNDVTEIVIHQELTYVDITNNCVILIDPIAALKKLKTLLIGNNKIVNLEPLVHHENFDPAWIAPAQQPIEKEDAAQMLTPGSSEQKIAELIKAENKKKEYSDYLQKTITLVAPQVKNNVLTISNQTCIKSLLFSDCLHIDTLLLNNCPNVSFEQLPVKIRHLSITNSRLIRLNGLEKMSQLESIDLTGNNLTKCELLAQLKKLKAINLTNNKIIDLKHIKQFIQFQNVLVSEQVKPGTSDFKKYLGQEGTDSQVQQLVAEMEENSVSNEEIIHDTEMLQMYKDKVVNGVLEINQDQNLTSTEFSALIGHINQKKVTELRIISCYNLKLDRCPKQSVKSLTINKCNLRDINGIQDMTQLTQLNLSLNQISDIRLLASLTNLTSLDLGQNNIECASVLSNVKQLVSLDLSENLITDLSYLRDLVKLQILDVSYNNLKSINDLAALSNIEQLNITQTNTCSIDILAKMTKMTNLLMSSNQIISIAVLKAFLELYDLRLENNFIQDFEPIVKHKFANKNWVREQKVPTETDFMNSFSCNKYEVAQLINKSKQQKEMSDNKYMLIKKYENDVKNSCLKINNEQKLNNLQFTDVLKLTELEAVDSQTIDFAEDQVPTLLLKLKLNNCTFKDYNMNLNPITGIYQIEQLVELDLSFNKIRDISEIGNLTNLKKLFLQNNDIHRINELRSLEKLTHLNLSNNKVIFSEPLSQLQIELLIDNNIVTDNITLNNLQKPQLINYKTFLGPNSTDDQINELSTIIPLDYNYNLQMVQKYSAAVKNSELKIENDPVLTDFGFTTEIKATTLTVLNCKNVKLPILQNVKYFKTNGGALVDYQEVKLIKVPSQITALTINGCQLTNVVGIELLKDLNYLNLKDNQIVLIEPVKQLSNLKRLFLDNNFIQDLNTLTSHQNYTLEWIYYQNSPTDQVIQNYLSDTLSTSNLNDFKTALQPFKAQTDQLILQLTQYENQLRTKYQSQIQNGVLNINGDSNVRDFKFVDQMNIQQLILNNCANVNLKRTPTKIMQLTVNSIASGVSDLTGIENMKQLQTLILANNSQIRCIKPIFSLSQITSVIINNTTLTNIVGIENMKQLQYVDLRDNCIISCEPLKHLINLQMLFIDNNCIQDLQFITTLPKYKLDWIYYQRTPTASDIQNYLKLSNIGAEFAKHFELKLQKTKELIRTGPEEYEQKMVQKYQNKVSGNRLEIRDDKELKDFKFVEKFNIKTLYIEMCPNVRFWRTPNNITCLEDVYNCGLKSVRGVEKMKQLQTLGFTSNNVVDISCLKELPNLTSLNVGWNKIVDFSPVQHLIDRGQVHNKEYQSTPTQQEIEDSKRLW
ncbi:Conserved_hypothetical protein [Hexamita inflata]|uniref:Uncharacterized protein n=1 Tax=Hexamita inflata TaxID=28002 RepID=A0AA86PH64_9EUKA|nr:Conserved hypothetical protein [Hexamita inflata]